MDKVRVALIGAGGMANAVHYPSLATFKDAELVAICDLDADKLAKTAAKFGIPQTFSNYKEMLDKTKPDAVYALMPPYVLFDVAMDVMERGHNLFIEKPPAATTHQTLCLAKKAEDKKLITAVGFQRRYHPFVHHCFEKVKTVGQPHQVVSHFLKATNIGPNYPYYRGAIDLFHCDAIHAVDALRYYCGLSKVKAVASDVRNLDSWFPVSFKALVYFENDAVGILHVNWRTGARSLKFEFHAAGASAYVDADGAGEVWFATQKDPVVKTTYTDHVQSKDTFMTQGFWHESRAFIDAIKAGRQVHNNLQDSVLSMELCDRILASAINKR